MYGGTEAHRRGLSCRRCGASVYAQGLPYEYRLKVYEETEAAQESIMRLCRPCADDFTSGDERDAYLERLVLA